MEGGCTRRGREITERHAGEEEERRKKEREGMGDRRLVCTGGCTSRDKDGNCGEGCRREKRK